MHSIVQLKRASASARNLINIMQDLVLQITVMIIRIIIIKKTFMKETQQKIAKQNDTFVYVNVATGSRVGFALLKVSGPLHDNHPSYPSIFCRLIFIIHVVVGKCVRCSWPGAGLRAACT